MIVANAILSLAALLCCLPVIIFGTEVLFALAAGRFGISLQIRRPTDLRVAVLVPAHDEAEAIAATVAGIAMQLRPIDRLIVVADNCTDATAQLARDAGAEAIVRADPRRRGKGYALDFGVQHLNGDPPDIVIVVDADCRLGEGMVEALAAVSYLRGCPAQSLYAMSLPPDADAKRRVAGFGWIIKNQVRPLGLAMMGLPCQLMGTGMAFPWKAIRSINLATDNIVEDVKMGIDLAAKGFAPVYCPDVRVVSDFPTSERGFAVQRARWEAGSLRLIMNTAPIMLLRGLASLNIPLIALAVDLLVPPLMMLLVAMALGFLLSCILAMLGGSLFPALVFGVLLGILLLTLVLTWHYFGRGTLLPGDVVALPVVFVRKFGLYLAIWRNRKAGWVRTDRK